MLGSSAPVIMVEVEWPFAIGSPATMIWTDARFRDSFVYQALGMETWAAH